jgi:hypothetical protein
MNGLTFQKLPTIDENLFYQLLEGVGTVHIDIAKIEQYFVPFVSLFRDDTAQRVPYGVIVRSSMDMLAAESVDDLLHLLDDLTGGCTTLKFNCSFI